MSTIDAAKVKLNKEYTWEIEYYLCTKYPPSRYSFSIIHAARTPKVCLSTDYKVWKIVFASYSHRTVVAKRIF